MTGKRLHHPAVFILVSFMLMKLSADCDAVELSGRLFTTPAERKTLDSLRRLPSSDNGQPPFVDSQATVEDNPTDDTVAINGLVYRVQGKSTVWINNNRILLDSEKIMRRPDAGDRAGDVSFEIPDYNATIGFRLRDQPDTDN